MKFLFLIDIIQILDVVPGVRIVNSDCRRETAEIILEVLKILVKNEIVLLGQHFFTDPATGFLILGLNV